MRREAGFTLLELLVALALLALLALGAFELLALVERVRAATPARAALAGRVEAGPFLASRLARALPLPVEDGVAFLGDPRRLRFVFAPLPEDPAGGLRVAELALEPEGEGTLLLWREESLPLDGDPFAPLERAPARPLARLAGESSLSFLLPAEDGEEVRVRGRVGPGDPFPLAVRLGPPAPRDPLDLLFLPLRVRALSDCAAGRSPCG